MSAGVLGLVGRLRAIGDSDAELLRAYAACRDADAFAALVRRHGPRVWATCRRVVGDSHAAEDAFQATFLVLARKADGLPSSHPLGGWLHAVAVNVSIRARTAADRRKRREANGEVEAVAPTPPEPPDERALAVLDEEIERLPAKLRDAVVLCELDGLSRKEAAGRLGVAEGTVSSRLAAARKRLAERLTDRGVRPELLAVTAAVPAGLAEAASGLGAGMVPAPAILALTGGTMRAMLLKGLAAGAVACGLLAVGGLAKDDPPAKPADAPKATSLSSGIWTTRFRHTTRPTIYSLEGKPTRPDRWPSLDRITHSTDGNWLACRTFQWVEGKAVLQVAVGRAGDPSPPRLLPPLDVTDAGPPGPNPLPGVTGSPLHAEGTLSFHWDSAGPTLVIHAYAAGTVRAAKYRPADGTFHPLPPDTPDGPRSPDGKSICLKVPVGPPSFPLRPHRLGLRPASGGATRLVSPFDREVWGLGRLPDPPQFSADGSRLLYQDGEVSLRLNGQPDPDVERVVALETDTGLVTPLAVIDLRASGGEQFTGFTWSPDGRRVAIGRTRLSAQPGRPATGRITVCDADGRNPNDLVSNLPGGVQVLDWR